MQLRKCCNHPYLFPGAEPDFDGVHTGPPPPLLICINIQNVKDQIRELIKVSFPGISMALAAADARINRSNALPLHHVDDGPMITKASVRCVPDTLNN